MDHLAVRVLELWFAPSGVAITLLLVVFTLFLCVFFSHRAQAIVREILDRGFRGRWRDAEIEIGPSAKSAPAQSEMTGYVPPLESQRPEPAGPLPPPASGIIDNRHDENVELSLQIKMNVAAINRDELSLDTAYEELKKLHDRQITNEELITFYLGLRYEMGDRNALKQLEALVTDQPTWYEPCLKLARIYAESESYDIANKWIDEAYQRARNESERILTIFIRKTVVASTKNDKAALDFLFSSLKDIVEEPNRAALWEQIADIYKGLNDAAHSFMALEKAVRLDPLNRHRRFRLAYRYADDENKKLLALYHYNKLVEQDERYPNALNNLALLINDLEMPAIQVNMLRRAKRFESPYPHGNLAFVAAKAGFLDEAVQFLEELPPEKRLETRAADASAFIRRRRAEESDRLEKVTAASEALHKVYLKAADAWGSPVEAGSLLGEWIGSSGEKLNLNELTGQSRLLGTLSIAAAEYDLRLLKVEALLTGTAQSKSQGLMRFTFEKKLALVIESSERMEGNIATDETSVKTVRFDRRLST